MDVFIDNKYEKNNIKFKMLGISVGRPFPLSKLSSTGTEVRNANRI